MKFEKVEYFGKTLTSESEVNGTRNLLSRKKKAFVSCGREN
jgi:hypothetical protein